MDDRTRKGRTGPRKGEHNGHAKLSDDKVRGYDEEGFVGSWSIRTTRDIDRLPGSLLYEVAK